LSARSGLFTSTGRKDSTEGILPVTDPLCAFSIRTLVVAMELDLNRNIIIKNVGKN